MIENLTRLLAFSSKNPEEDAKKIDAVCPSLEHAMHVDAFVIKEALGGKSRTADFIRLVAAVTSRRETDKFKPMKKYSRESIEEYIKGLFFGLSVECLYALSFDEQGRFISSDIISEGTVNSASFIPRKLLDATVRKQAKTAIVAHNHPCGSVEPSSHDMSTTHLIKSVLESSGVELSAHYVVSGFNICECTALLSEDSKK